MHPLVSRETESKVGAVSERARGGLGVLDQNQAQRILEKADSKQGLIKDVSKYLEASVRNCFKCMISHLQVNICVEICCPTTTFDAACR